MWLQLRTTFWESVAIGLFMTLLVIVSFQVSHFLGEARHSPSLVLQPAYRLSELVPEINPKDSSKHSFPGDHALVLFMVSICIWFFAGRERGMLAIGISSLEVFPRLVGGAHWLTDILVGALSTALIATSLTLALPLYALAIRWIYRQLECHLRARFPTGWK
jgi:membrane-associated phospholipid phosphatase